MHRHLNTATVATWLLVALLSFLVSGCSTFNRDWRRHAPASTDDFEGRWRGSWHSDANGHHGELRCIVSQLADTRYETRYRASYLGILRFEYSLPVEVSRDDGVISFTGQADLGTLAGGLYTYKGSVTGDTFRAMYESKRDYGTFQMDRQ